MNAAADAYFEECERSRDQSSSRAEEMIEAFFASPGVRGEVDFISPLGLVKVVVGDYDWFASRNFFTEGLLSEVDECRW